MYWYYKGEIVVLVESISLWRPGVVLAFYIAYGFLIQNLVITMYVITYTTYYTLLTTG